MGVKMNKKIILSIITVFFLLEGCGKATPANTGNQNVKSPSAATTTNSSVAKSTDTTAPAATNSADAKSTVTTTTPAAKIATSDNIDYNQYIKKIWVVKSSANNGVYENSSFCISKIVNGEITGYFVLLCFNSFHASFIYMPPSSLQHFVYAFNIALFYDLNMTKQ